MSDEVYVSSSKDTVTTATVYLNFSANEFSPADNFEVVLEIIPTTRMVDYPHLRPVTKKVRLNNADLYRLGLNG